MDSKSESNQSRPRESVKILYDHELKNAPGMSIVGIEVTYPPGGFTPPHRHSGATVVARVTEGTLLSGMNGNPPKLYEVGEGFMEMPGCHHTVSENNSQDHGAKFTAVIVIDTEIVKRGYENLTVLDKEWQ
ncbi:cupin domain protein [Colletotrichum truncatum]|uniref:Cupin domain protein n=1 Tax=Colletotrichum truncatum TaxID=5467 RepID=A0ACC3YW62_COLTU|nr:cupin domain protein [Colletotrichum truncatum]KAF6787360.1 cupin domain protein [Colletotrichum truncatum]